MIRKKLSKVQQYAVVAAKAKARRVDREIQFLLQDIAKELGVNHDKVHWRLSADMEYFEREDDPIPPEKNSSEKTITKKTISKRTTTKKKK